jgi:hypothetical protein
MKKLISYTLIASMLSASLMGCASSKPPQNIVVFGENTYTNDFKKTTVIDGYQQVKSEDYFKNFEKINSNGEKIEIRKYSGSEYSDIRKTSRKYNNYLSCVTDFNKDNKSMLEIINKADKSKKANDNNTFVYYGGSKFNLFTSACEEKQNKSSTEKEYQYVIYVTGFNDEDTKETISKIGEVTGTIILAPVMLVIGIVFFPIFLIGMCVAYCFK